jgi:polyamine oxidase
MVSQTSALILAASAAAAAPLDADVIIIGAGWAGMGAADYLARHNFSSFLVLEASGRTGGRTHALPAFGHDSVGKFVVERGSNWVQSTLGGAGANTKAAPNVRFNPMQLLAEKYKLHTTLIHGSTQNMSNYAAVYDADGVRADLDGSLRARANAAYDCLNVTAQSAGTALSVREALAGCGWNPESDVEWAVDWVLTVDDPGFPAELQEAQMTLPDESYEWWGNNDWFVVDQSSPRGWARLLDEMVADWLRPGDPRLKLNATVVNIGHGCAGANVTLRDGSVLRAKQVLSTLPLGVLQRNLSTLFTPPLPKKHAEVIEHDGIIMGNLTHVLFQFSSVWWDDALPRWVSANKGASQNQTLSGEFSEVQNLNHASMIPGSQILLTFLGDPQSSLYEGMSDAGAQAAAMERLRMQHPKMTIPDPVAFFISRHGYDPLSYGAYSGFMPGFKDKFIAKMKEHLKSCGHVRVRFAGEATCDDLSGYTHGGLQSGIEAAAHILHDAGLGPNPGHDDALSLCDW